MAHIELHQETGFGLGFQVCQVRLSGGDYNDVWAWAFLIDDVDDVDKGIGHVTR